MKGSSIHGDHEFFPPQTFVLVGKKGTGKSATGNSILGASIFKSQRSSSGVTLTCELQSTKLQNGPMINVIDTPGMFGSCGDIESTAKEMISCMEMAGDGVHAFLFVFSIHNRFSKEEEAAISSLQKVFGRMIYDYMILVFTGGDELEKDGETLEEFLNDCPPKLKELVNLCEDRCVLFDNKTKDETKRSDQLEKLFSLANTVARKNCGKLYNNEILTQLKEETKEFKEEAENFQALKETKRYSADGEISTMTDPVHGGQFKSIFDMVEPKLKSSTMLLERQIAEERAERLKAEENVKAIQEKSDELMCIMKELYADQMAMRRRKGDYYPNGPCVIL